MQKQSILNTVKTKNFAQHCNSVVNVALTDLKEQLQINKTYKIKYIVIALICLAIGTNWLWLPYSEENVSHFGMLFTLLRIVAPVVFIPTSVYCIIKSSLANLKTFASERDLVLEKLFSYWGKFKHLNFEMSLQNIDNARVLLNQKNSQYCSLTPFIEANLFEIISCFEGQFNGLNLEFAKLSLKKDFSKSNTKKQSNKKKNNDVEIFDGTIVTVRLPQNIEGRTFVLNSKSPINLNTDVFQAVDIGSMEFLSEFNIYSTSELEAGLALTPLFMNALLFAKKKLNLPINAFFENGCLHFAILSKENFFNLPDKKNMHLLKSYEKVVMDFLKILTLIDVIFNENK